MPDRIPVFDDWGKKVGDFIPVGGSGEGAIAILLAFVLVYVVGFVFYLIYRLIVTAIQDAKQGKWATAVFLISFTALCIFLLVIAAINSRIETAAKQAEYQAKVDAQTAAVAWIKANPDKILAIRRIGGISKENETQGIYQVTGSSKLDMLEVYVSSNCTPEGIKTLKGGESIALDCKEQTQTQPFNAWEERHWISHEVCIYAQMVGEGVENTTCISPFADKPHLSSFVTLSTSVLRVPNTQWDWHIVATLSSTGFNGTMSLGFCRTQKPVSSNNGCWANIEGDRNLLPNTSVTYSSNEVWSGGWHWNERNNGAEIAFKGDLLCVQLSAKDHTTEVICQKIPSSSK